MAWHTHRLVTAVLALCCAVAVASAQTDTRTRIYDERVRSLTCVPAGMPYQTAGIPVIDLDGQRSLRVEFDILGEDRQYLRYTLTHCTAGWQPSQVSAAEYLDGFNEDVIEEHDFSDAVTVHYVHYALTIPSPAMRPLLSGNYLLTVYDESDPDTPLLRQRFAVSEQTAAVSASVTSRTDIDFNRSHQQLSLAVGLEHARVEDPFNDITVVVMQNGRPDNAVTLDKPMRMSGKTLVYEHQRPLIFDAGNEYRRFETVSTAFTPMGVDAVEWHGPYWHWYLVPDQTRFAQSYHYDQTPGGAFVVRNYDTPGASATSADYGVVHFALQMPQLPGHDIYIDSDFTQRLLDDNALMRYDDRSGTYRRAMLLKQGAYSYQYLAVPHDGGKPTTAIVEGNKFETRNNYSVYVYHRRRGERHDRLIGFGTIQFQ